MKKLICCLAVLAMTLSFGVVAFAEEPVAEINGQGFSDFQTAVDEAKDGETVILLENLEFEDKLLKFSGEKKITLDLNGHTITGIFKTETQTFVSVTGGCELTVKDNSEGQTGGIHAVSTEEDKLSNLIRVETDGKMVIESGNFSQNDSTNGSGMIDSRGDDIITINGGNFRLDDVGTARNGSPWLLNTSGQNEQNIIVNGGTFNGDIIHQHYPFEVQAPKEKALRNNGDGTYTMVNAVAYVDEREKSTLWYTNRVRYATLEEAVAAAELKEGADGGNTVTLISDVEFTEALVINKDIPVILNLNGNDFSGKIEVQKELIIEGEGTLDCEITLAAENATVKTTAGNLNSFSSVEGFSATYKEGKYQLITHEDSHETIEKVIKEATCEEDGEKGDWCTVCLGYVNRGGLIPAIGHKSGEWKTIKEATCEEDGESGYWCNDCEEYVERGAVIPAFDHEMGEWEIDKEATCETNGKMVRYCKYGCGKSETKTIKARHNFEDGVCERCGKESSSGIIGGDSSSEKEDEINPNTGAPVFSFVPVFAAAVLLFKRK